MLTGMCPRHHGRIGYQDGVPWTYAHTLPRCFTEAGYQTKCVGKMHVHPLRSRQGFEDVELHDGFLHYYRSPMNPYYESQMIADDYLYEMQGRGHKDLTDTGIGGVKEATLMIKGKGAYSRLKYESGVHRVQRVPETESSGRIHTSAATIAVLPEVDDVAVEVNPNDVRVDVYRSSGNGGQCVNTTDSAVRLTHIPTGLVVTCQDEKSQIKNKEKAFKVLKARLYDLKMQEQNKEISEQRKSMVGSGDRSERIRTYNFPQGRISDHRIGMTIYKLDAFMDGDIDEVIDGLITAEQAEKMKNF